MPAFRFARPPYPTVYTGTPMSWATATALASPLSCPSLNSSTAPGRVFPTAFSAVPILVRSPIWLLAFGSWPLTSLMTAVSPNVHSCRTASAGNGSPSAAAAAALSAPTASMLFETSSMTATRRGRSIQTRENTAPTNTATNNSSTTRRRTSKPTSAASILRPCVVLCALSLVL